MQPMALAGAVAGGGIGAVIWAIVACTTGYEIGYLAWGVGGLVGFGAYALGGRGQAAGVTCAAMALGSILAGKMLAVGYVVQNEGLEELYDFLQPQAIAYADCHTEADCRVFMIQNGYTEATRFDDISEEELWAFRMGAAPILEDLGESPPSFEEWQERPVVKAYFEAATEELSTADIVVGSLGPVDLIFALLGVITAYRVCTREDS